MNPQPYTQGTWNVEQTAALGLPSGQYIVRIDEIAAGLSGNKDPKVQFTASNMIEAANGVAAGKKHVWSYLLAHAKYPDIKNMLARDLVRSGVRGDLPIDPAQLAAILSQQMVGRFYVLNVQPQKNDPSNTNTTIVQPYDPAGAVAAPVAAPAYAPPPPIAAAPSPFPPAPAAYAPPPAAPAPFPQPGMPAAAAWPAAPGAVAPPPLPMAAAPAPAAPAPPYDPAAMAAAVAAGGAPPLPPGAPGAPNPFGAFGAV